MMTEAHVHALVNLKKESVVVISDKYVNKKVKRLACFLYTPGWAEQEEVCKRELNSFSKTCFTMKQRKYLEF